jgi:hypothetical protein
MREYESIVGGTGKIKPLLPPIICTPTISGTGNEVNPFNRFSKNALIKIVKLGIIKEQTRSGFSHLSPFCPPTCAQEQAR